MRFVIDLDLSGVEGFSWDKGNLNKNRLKHNVEPTECEEIFFNKPVIVLPDEKHSTNKEKRYRIIGVSTNGRKIALAITIRNNKIRVIMARDQSKKERTLYKAEK